MPEVAEAVVDRTPARNRGLAATIKKRWRAWLRAIHRDIGYLAVGFTMIYALSGIAMNHIDDWDPNFHATEVTRAIAPVPDELSDAEAATRIAAAAGITSSVEDVYRAGDEVRLSFAGGAKATAIGDTLTVQTRRDRLFFRLADWLHATRGKQAWKYIADAYAVLLLYLAVSGIFMIKGRLGLRGRGATLIALGLAGPVGYIVLSGGPGAQKTERAAARPGEVDPPRPGSSGAGGAGSRDETGIRPLPPDDPAAAPPARTDRPSPTEPTERTQRTERTERPSPAETTERTERTDQPNPSDRPSEPSQPTRPPAR